MQNEMNITELDMRTAMGKMPNWKTPGPDLVQGFGSRS